MFRRNMLNIKINSFATIFAGLVAAGITGVYAAWTSVYLPKLLVENSEIQFTSSEGSWITISLCVGGIAGSVIYSTIYNKLGRKLSLLTTTLPLLSSSLLLAFGTSVIIFCLARILGGIGIGGFFIIIPQYFGEIAHKTIRGSLGAWIYIFYFLGMLFINVIGTYMSVKNSSLFILGIIVLFLILFIWVTESPYFLIMTKQNEKAINSLQIFQNKYDVENEFQRIKQAVIEQTENRGNFFELFTLKSNRKALLILFIVLNARTLTGDLLYDTYSQTIFNQISNFSPVMLAVFYYLSKLFVVFLNSFYIDQIGRRPILLISLLGSAIILLIIATYLHFVLYKNVVINNSLTLYIIIFVMILFNIFYTFLIVTPIIILSELFPMNVKAFASCLYCLYYFLSSLAVVKFFEVITDCEFLGMDVAFFTFSLSCFIHFVLVYIFVFETKGKTLEEIQKQLQKLSDVNVVTTNTEL